MLGDDEVFEVPMWISQHLFFLSLKVPNTLGFAAFQGGVEYIGG